MHTLRIALVPVTTVLLACAATASPYTTQVCPPVASGTRAGHLQGSKSAHTPDDLFAAIRARDCDTVEALVEDDPALAGAHTPKGASAILLAAFMLNPDEETFVKPGNNAMLRVLLRVRPPLDVFDAAIAGDTTRLSALLSGDPTLANARHPVAGSAPLHLAAFADRAGAMELLLANGAVVDLVATNRFRNTPLVVAMLGDAVNAATLLLAKGANVEAEEEGGFRALHIAAESGDARLVQLLLDHGAEVSARADDGTTPLGVALKKGRSAIATLLRGRGAT